MTKKQLVEELNRLLESFDEDVRFASVGFNRVAYEDKDIVQVSYCALV